jgi:hypothetical protein
MKNKLFLWKRAGVRPALLQEFEKNLQGEE